MNLLAHERWQNDFISLMLISDDLREIARKTNNKELSFLKDRTTDEIMGWVEKAVTTINYHDLRSDDVVDLFCQAKKWMKKDRENGIVLW